MWADRRGRYVQASESEPAMRKSGMLGGLALLLVVISRPLCAEDLSVTSPAELADALAGAGPGTVISLAPGDYGTLDLKRVEGTAEEPVVLRSADAEAQARLSSFDLRDVKHFVLEGLVFDYSFAAGDPPNLRPFQIVGCADVTVRNSVFDGDVAQGVSDADDGFPTGFGLSLRDVETATIEGNEVRGFFRGMVISQTNDLQVLRNDLHGLRMDGMNFAQVERVVIAENHIHDFARVLESNDHADMIQFWTNGTTAPSTDITIRDNILNAGTGWYTQSIFMRNDQVDTGKAGPEMFYRNVTIQNNVVINAHLHGITLGETAGVTITNNTVIRNARAQGREDNPGLWTPQIRVAPASTGVVISHNVTSKVDGFEDQTDWTLDNNVFVQDRFPSQAGYYDAVFVAARGGDPTNLANFAYLPGGPLDGAKIGASQLDLATGSMANAGKIPPVIQAAADPQNINRYRFEARPGTLPAGVSIDQLSYKWDLGDGTTAKELVVIHEFTDTGMKEVSLTITLPDGSTATARNVVSIKGPEVLVFSPETGRFTSFAARDPVVVPEIDLGPGAAILGQGASPIVIPVEMIAPFFQAQNFQIDMRVRGLPSYRSAGELFRIHGNLYVTVTGRGALAVRFDTGIADSLKFTTGPAPLFGGDWVNLSFRYDAAAGLFTVLANDAVIGQGTTVGQTRPMERWGLALGNPFATRESFDGEMEALSVQVLPEERSTSN
jgi:parallel beta-helix repeat protein